MKNEVNRALVTMKKYYTQPQVELTLLAATNAILGASVVQDLHEENAHSTVQF